LLLLLGLVMLWLFTFVVSLPSGLDFIAIFALGIIPSVAGAAALWSGWRTSGKSDPEFERLSSIKDQIIWRAMALGGRITADEAAAHAGLPEMEVELVLMSLVSEGRASAEAGEGGRIVYQIVSPV
jgi:hypothetical protein